jgi:hypothetical protein
MWLPAALLVAWGVLAAGGFLVSPTSHAATSTVNATVALDVHIGGTCAAGTNFPSQALGLSTNTSLAACDLTFGTNNGASSTVRVESPRAAGHATFCQAGSVSANCSGGTGFASPTANDTALVDGEFAIRTTAITSCTTPTWTNTNYNGVPDSSTGGFGDLICTMTGTTDGDYDLEFFARRGVATVAGTYIGQAVFTAEAA